MQFWKRKKIKIKQKQVRNRRLRLVKSRKYLESLNDKSVEELRAELVTTKKELFNLRFQNATNQLDNTARIREVRKNIARIQTVMTQRAKGIAQ